jgi:hypothetical protein
MIIPEILWRDQEYKDCKWRHHGQADSYENLEWDSSNTVSKPTKAQLQSKWASISTEIAFEKLRVKRDKLLAETDWWAVSDRTMSSEEKSYRSALRDITQTAQPTIDQWGNLNESSVTWPAKP